MRSCRATGDAGSVALFVLGYAVILSMYGGGFATIPAYLRDLFGTMQVGAIHGRLLTAWSTAGMLGPVLVNYIREYQIDHGVAKADAYTVDDVPHGRAAGGRLRLQPAHARRERGRRNVSGLACDYLTPRFFFKNATVRGQASLAAVRFACSSTWSWRAVLIVLRAHEAVDRAVVVLAEVRLAERLHHRIDRGHRRGDAGVLRAAQEHDRRLDLGE